MTHLKTLLKVDLLNTLSLNSYKNTKKQKAKSKSPLVATIISGVFLFALLSIYAVMISFICYAEDKINVIIIYGVGLGGFLTLLMTYVKSYGVLFQNKDFELLCAMPIPVKTIATSKFLSLIIANYFYFNASVLPALFCYYIFGGFSVLNLFLGLLTVALGPLFPTLICAFVSYFIGRLLQNFKYKNFVNNFISIAFLLLIFYFSFSLSFSAEGLTDDEYNILLIESLESKFGNGYFVSKILANAFSGDFLNILYFLLLSIAPLFLFIWFYSKNFIKINSSLKSGYKNKNFNLSKELVKEKDKKINQTLTLIKKEYKTIFSYNIYTMNVIIGPILALIAGIAIITQYTKLELPTEVMFYLPLAIILVEALCIGMSPSTNCAISIEGKNMWLLKTSPINTNKVLIAKMLTYVLMCIPFIIVNGVLCIIFMKNVINIVDYISIFISPIIITIAFSSISLWINILNHKFDWNNPAEVVKSSSGTLICMLVDFLLEIVLIVPTIAIGIIFSNVSLPILFMAIVVCAISLVILFTNGVKKYECISV